MKILYAGYGTIGLIGLVNILSFDRFSVDDIYLLNDPKDKLASADILRKYAISYGLKMYDEPIKDNLEFDLIISVHWRKLLSIKLIEAAKIGGMNLHPSLLPKYAGCSSLAWALVNSEKKVGFTWHLLDKDFDTGKIILQEELNVKETDNAFSLWNRVNLLGVNKINRCIDLLCSKEQEFIEQDLSKRTFYPRGFPSFKKIKEIIPDLSHNTYLKASYFPNKSS